MIHIHKIAQELRDKFLEYDDFVGLYLYGSRVKGTANEDSDIDVAAVFQTDRTYDRTVGSKVYDLILKYDITIDLQRITLNNLKINFIYENEIKKGYYY